MLTLYEHPFALYCQKVLVALNEQGVAYDVLFYNILLNTFQSYPYVSNVQISRPLTANLYPALPPATSHAESS